MRGLVAEVVRRLGAVAARYPGAWVEDKRLGLTLHYRRVPGRYLDDLWAGAAALIREYGDRLRVVEGPEVWEAFPALGLNKGSALRQIVDLAGGRVVPLYAGDAPSDAEAVEAASALGGVSVGVGRDAPAGCQYRVDSPDELGGVLAGLVEALAAGGLGAA
jgi:trehalose 6-phosphate phosphatase